MHAPAPGGSSQFWLGVRTFAPVAISIAAYGVVWGVLAGQAGMSVAEVALMSGLVVQSRSQVGWVADEAVWFGGPCLTDGLVGR